MGSDRRFAGVSGLAAAGAGTAAHSTVQNLQQAISRRDPAPVFAAVEDAARERTELLPMEAARGLGGDPAVPIRRRAEPRGEGGVRRWVGRGGEERAVSEIGAEGWGN